MNNKVSTRCTSLLIHECSVNVCRTKSHSLARFINDSPYSSRALITRPVPKVRNWALHLYNTSPDTGAKSSLAYCVNSTYAREHHRSLAAKALDLHYCLGGHQICVQIYRSTRDTHTMTSEIFYQQNDCNVETSSIPIASFKACSYHFQDL